MAEAACLILAAMRSARLLLRAIALPSALVLVAQGLGACATGQRVLWQSGLPWVRGDFQVDSVTPRPPFLDLAISGGGIQRRVFARDSEDCRAVFAIGETVSLGRGDRFGPAHREDRTCELAGIGDLQDWRRSRSIGGYGRSPIRRSSVRIEIVHRDADYAYARGGFSIAAMLSWAPGSDQVVALLPHIDECARVDSGFYSVIFRQTGTPALGVVNGDDLCPIAGLVAVLPGDFAEAASP
jgi:hypothetical protein